MDYLRLRLGESERVPLLSQDVWFLVVVNESDRLVPYEFRGTGEGLKALVSFLEVRQLAYRLMVFGIWHGQYRTDAFVMNPWELAKKAMATLEVRKKGWQRSGVSK